MIRELPDGTAPVVGVDALVTNDSTPALTGTVDDAFASVSVTVNGETLDAVNNGDGTWLLADNQLTALTEGVYDVQVEATDVVGNVGSDTTSDELEIDLTVPVVSVASLVTSDSTPGLSGTVDDASAIVTVTVDGQVVSAVNNGNGTWAVADNVLSVLSDGVYDVLVTAEDVAGNVGQDSTDSELTIDSTGPLVTVDSLVTNDSMPALTGTIDDSGATISVTVDGQTLAATNNQNGTWLLADNALSALSDGVYDVSVTATDVIGNVGSDGTTNELVIDTVSPVVGVNALLTNDTTPELTGTIDDTLASVTVVVDGQTVSAANNGDGTWTVADGVLTSLAEGVYDVQVTAVDLAGNVGSDGTTNELDIDLGALVVSVDSLATNDVTPTLTGSVNDNSAVVTVSVGGQSGQAVNNQDGSWSFEVPIGLSEGVYDVSVTAVDVSSNSVNDSTTNELTIDTTAPVVGIDSLITNDTTPGLTGTVDDSGASVSVTVDGQTLAATNNGDGTWSLADNALSALAEGTFDVVVLAEDAVGNQGSDGTSGELVVDLTSPLVAVNSLSTNDSRPALSGTIDDASADVSLTVDGQVRSAVNNGDGTWTLADDSLSTLSDGVYDVSVTATDIAGNVGSDSTSDELVINTTAPVVTVDSLTTEDPSPALSGTVDDPTALISLVIGGQSRVGVNQGDGTWTLADDSLLPFPDGTYDVVVSATDSFGNVGQDATVDELVIDTSTRYDFGTSSSPVASGHIAVTGSPYSSSSGFGWESGNIGVRDRGSSSSDLNRDFNFTSGTGVFVVDVANGTYDVTLTMGDASFAQ
ncbi:Ig-like domain-containing protein, partial [Rubripirellula sp.]|nr:Ig-like domain-containing protein [Rubripirellula sp.]